MKQLFFEHSLFCPKDCDRVKAVDYFGDDWKDFQYLDYSKPLWQWKIIGPGIEAPTDAFRWVEISVHWPDEHLIKQILEVRDHVLPGCNMILEDFNKRRIAKGDFSTYYMLVFKALNVVIGDSP